MSVCLELHNITKIKRITVMILSFNSCRQLTIYDEHGKTLQENKKIFNDRLMTPTVTPLIGGGRGWG